MKPIKLTPHSRKRFKFLKKQGPGTFQTRGSKVFTFPNASEEAKRKPLAGEKLLEANCPPTDPEPGNSEETNMSETRKLYLPAFDKTLRSKMQALQNSRNKNFISETCDNIPSKPNPPSKSRNTNISINMPKTFDMNMKKTHLNYLRREKVSQVMKKKDLRIEIPELRKEEDFVMNHAELLKKLKSYIDKKSGGSAVKKKTTDVDIEFL